MDREELRATAAALMDYGEGLVNAALDETSERRRNDAIAIASGYFLCAMGMEALRLHRRELEMEAAPDDPLHRANQVGTMGEG